MPELLLRQLSLPGLLNKRSFFLFGPRATGKSSLIRVQLPIAIEIKASSNVTDKHFKGLKMLAEENICKQYLLVSQDPINRKYSNCEAIYWQDFLKKLWSDQIVGLP